MDIGLYVWFPESTLETGGDRMDGNFLSHGINSKARLR
jgi:hypothetical protein